MYTYDYVKSLITIENNHNIIRQRFIRTNEIQSKYTQHITICKQNHLSVKDHILHNVVDNFTARSILNGTQYCKNLVISDQDFCFTSE